MSTRDHAGAARPKEGRSPRWPAAERAHLRREPRCRVCGETRRRQVHHVRPYHLFPALELDPANLVTLCEPHHLLVGHLMLWASWNAAVLGDADAWRAKIAARPAKE